MKSSLLCLLFLVSARIFTSTAKALVFTQARSCTMSYNQGQYGDYQTELVFSCWF